MAGRESPNNIKETYFKDQSISLLLTQNSYKNMDKEEFNTRKQILKEGIYINESINHLKYYFNKKNSVNFVKEQIKVTGTDFNNYDQNKYIINPQNPDTDKTKICCTIPILNMLNELSGYKEDDQNYLPTKFITLVCVRQEPSYCDQILETLDFANQIKSS
jgi:hypothetical protein